MNELMKFDFNGHNLSARVDENGIGWFIAKDVCTCLNIKNYRNVIAKLDDDEKLMSAIWTSGQRRSVWHVNEQGIWRLTFTSKKPEAEHFKRVLAHEILPQIHRTGMYVPPALQQHAAGFSPEAVNIINKAAGAITVLRSSNQALYRENAHLREMEKLREQNGKIGKPLLPEEKARIADYVALGYDAPYITRLLNRRSDCAVRTYLKKVQADEER